MDATELERLIRNTQLVDTVTVELRPLASQRCRRCGISSATAGIELDASGTCNECTGFAAHGAALQQYFRTPRDLEQIFEQNRHRRRGEYDCVLLYSGGKDSTYVLHQLIDMGLKVVAYTFDNGFISRQALENIESITAELGVESVVQTHQQMRNVFKESLSRYSTVCKGCFKGLLDLSLEFADVRGINIIVTGLSRGQIVEERLKRFYEMGIHDVSYIEDALAKGRQVYHMLETFQDLDARRFGDGRIFDRVQLVDYFRYSDVSKAAIFDYLKSRSVRWKQPQDTGFCSSNCMINDVGIAVHGAERGYSNYEVPTAWEVRLGHLERAAALEELAGVTNKPAVEKILRYVDYRPRHGKSRSELRARCVLRRNVSRSQLEHAIRAALPPDSAFPDLILAATTDTAAAATHEATSGVGHVPHELEIGPEDLSPDRIDVRVFRTATPVGRELLNQALLAVLLQHRSLRARVVEDGGRLRLDHQLQGGVPCVHLDLSAHTEGQRRQIVNKARAQLAARVAEKPFQGLLRFVALTPDPFGGTTLLVAAHELLMDDFSWNVLLADIRTAYVACAAGQRVRLAAPELLAQRPPVRALVPATWSEGSIRQIVLEAPHVNGAMALERIVAAVSAHNEWAKARWTRIEHGRELPDGQFARAFIGTRAMLKSDAAQVADADFCAALLPAQADVLGDDPFWEDRGVQLRAAGAASWVLVQELHQGLRISWRQNEGNVRDSVLGQAIGNLECH